MARRRKRGRGLGHETESRAGQSGQEPRFLNLVHADPHENVVTTTYRDVSPTRRPPEKADLKGVVALGLNQQADALIVDLAPAPREALVLSSQPPPPRLSPAASPAPRPGPRPAASRNLREMIASALALSLVAGVCYGSMRVVPGGAVGLVDCPWSAEGSVLNAGRHLIVPVVCGMSLFAAGDVRLDIEPGKATAGDGLTLQGAALSVVYRIAPEDIPEVIAADGMDAWAVGRAEVQSPLEGRIRSETDRLFRRMVELVQSDDLAAMRTRLAMLLQEDLQASIDDIHRGRVRIVSVEIPYIAPDPRVAKLLERRAWEQAASQAGVDAHVREAGLDDVPGKAP